jgi:hypothetical protein
MRQRRGSELVAPSSCEYHRGFSASRRKGLINSQFLNQVELTGKPLNVWNTINFSLTNSWVSGLLQTGYSKMGSF